MSAEHYIPELQNPDLQIRKNQILSQFPRVFSHRKFMRTLGQLRGEYPSQKLCSRWEKCNYYDLDGIACNETSGKGCPLKEKQK